MSGGQFKKSKPDPEIYLYTAERLGVQPEECLAVEGLHLRSAGGAQGRHDGGGSEGRPLQF